jgi:hypothetical protein
MRAPLQVKLKYPHPQQLSVKQSSAKRRVIVAGRRGGKTTGAAGLAVEGMLAGRRILEAAPTADQTDAFWAECKRALTAPIATGVVYKNETDRLLQLSSGGRIRCKTAWDADSLRGDYADLLILDEYSLMKPSAWDEVGAPMLLDNDGDAIFIGTPKRKNHFYTLYVHALGDMTGRWRAWCFPSHDNPHLSKTALAEITKDMTKDAYRQEILAEFLDNEGTVFRNIAACMTAPATTPAEHAGHTIAAGLDWGKQHDYTAISLVCQQCAYEVVHDRFNQVDYHFQRDRLRVLYDRWHIQTILAEANSIGEPNIEELRREGMNVISFDTTASSKPPLIEALALALERESCRWLPDPIWQAELEAYERTVSPNTGMPRYNAPEGVHDDTVMARALALAALGRSLIGRLFY